MGLVFEVDAADVDESVFAHETAAAYVERLALAKSLTIAERCDDATVVLAADTCVVLDGAILGKPATAADAFAMLQSLSGRDHVVLTGVSLRYRDRCAAFDQIVERELNLPFCFRIHRRRRLI